MGTQHSSERKLYKPPEFVTQNREAVLNQPELLCSSARMLLSPNTVLLQNKPSTVRSLEKHREEPRSLFQWRPSIYDTHCKMTITTLTSGLGIPHSRIWDSLVPGLVNCS